MKKFIITIVFAAFASASWLSTAEAGFLNLKVLNGASVQVGPLKVEQQNGLGLGL